MQTDSRGLSMPSVSAQTANVALNQKIEINQSSKEIKGKNRKQEVIFVFCEKRRE